MPYDSLIYNETLMLEITIIGLLLAFTLVAVMVFISIRDQRRYIPVLRPVSDPARIQAAVRDFMDTRNFYHSNTSYLLESKNAVSDVMSRKKVGLILMENIGNTSALDVEFITLGDYFISDGPETKPVSMKPGEPHSCLFYLPEDMVSDLLLYPVKIRFKAINGRRLTNRFHVAISPEPRILLDDGTELRIYLQI